MFRYVKASLAVVLTLACTARTTAISITPPGAAPSSAIGPIDHSFVGLGIESASLPDYAGNLSSPNNFSVQLIENIANKTGAPVFIRVGGTSLDNATYDPSQQETIIFPPGQEQRNVPSNISLGPSWFQSFETFPSTKWILQVPFQFATVDQSVTFAKAGLKAITAASLQSIELGNEPNFYLHGSFTPKDYVSKFAQYSAALSSQLQNLLPQGPIYQGLTIASGASLPPWDVATLFDAGVDSAQNLKTVSYHYYQTTRGNNVSSTLLNHTDTRTHLDVFTPSIASLRQNNPNITFVLGEAASSLNGVADNGTQVNDFGLESTLGAAVWTADFLLYSMSIGVGRVSLQQIRGAGYDGWQPAPLQTENYGLEQPAGLPPYYGYLFVADFIGNGVNGKDVTMVNLKLYRERAVGYAAFEGGVLERVALLNTVYWLQNSGTERPTTTFELTLPGDVKSVRVEKLMAPGGAEARDGVTWAGKSYTFASGGKGEATAPDGVTVVNVGDGGKVSVDVPAVEAWLLYMQR